MSDTTGLLDKIMNLYTKYGFKKILKGTAAAIFIGYMVFFALNPSYIYNKWKQAEEEKHQVEISKRFETTNKINDEIERIQHKLGADRVFIIEFHNSVKSLNGYPFTFGSMNFEYCEEGVTYVGDEYTNFNLSKYKFIGYLYNHSTFFGNVEEVKGIDNRLYLKFLSNDVVDIALITIEGVNSPNGILGITYTSKDDNRDWNKIKSCLRQEAVRIGVLFNK